jgi:organic radical activating enzyme
MISTTEVFYALQAEGNASTLYGLPTVFYRLGVGCTLTCKGFGVPVIKDGIHLKDKDGNLLYGCDSFDSVYPQFKNRATKYTAEQAIEKYYEVIPKLSYKNMMKPSITISGGEPSLFLKDKELQKFIAYFVSRDIPVLMETNGTVMIDFSIPHLNKVIYSISPKLSCSGEPFEKRIKIDALENIINNAEHSYLKFVVSEDGFYNSTEGNMSEWEEIRYILNNISPYVKHVMFMGLGGVNDEKFNKNQKFAYEKALELGFGFSPRTHISLYGDEKFK